MKASRSGLSRAFRRERVHAGAHSGGGISVSERGFLACMYFGRVNILEAVAHNLRCRVQNEGEDDDEEGSLVCVCIKPTADEVVTADRQLRLRRWGVAGEKATLEKTVARATEAPVLALAYDKSGTLVVTGGSDRLVRVFDMEKGFCTHSFRGHMGLVHHVTFAPTTKPLRALSCSEDTCVKVWDLHDNRCVATVKGHMSAVTGVAFDVAAKVMVTCARDQVLSFWDLETFGNLLNVPVYEEMEGVQILPAAAHRMLVEAGEDAEYSGLVAAAGGKGLLRVWAYRREDAGKKTGKDKGKAKKKIKVKLVKEQSDGPTPELGYKGILLARRGADAGAPEAEQILAVSGDHNFLFFDMNLDFQKLTIGYNDDILDVKELPAGDGDAPHRVVVATNSADVRIFDTVDFSVVPVQGHTDTVLSVDVSKDGAFLATASKDKTLRLWDLRPMLGDSSSRLSDVPCLMECRGHTDAVGAVCIAQKAAAAAAGSVTKWEALWEHAFLASAASDKTLKVWLFPPLDKASGKLSSPQSQTPALSIKAHDKDINAVAIAPNDSLIATASQDKAVHVYELRIEAGKARAKRVELDLKFQLKGHKRGVWMVKFSPIDRAIATSSGDRTIKIWGLANGQCLKTFQGHTSSVLNMAFLRNGMQLASCGADGLIKIWTIRTNECEATIDAHSDKIWALAATHDGGHLLSGGSDSTLVVWKDVTVEEEERQIVENELMVEKEQELANSLYKRDFRRAAALSFELDKPLRLLKVLSDYLDQQWMRSAEKQNPFVEMVATWNEKYVWKSLEYLKTWNANMKHMVLAQLLLDALLRTRISPKSWKRHKDSLELCDGILTYTSKHAERVDRLIEASYLVDHVLRCNTELLDADPTQNGAAVTPNLEDERTKYTIAEEAESDEDLEEAMDLAVVPAAETAAQAVQDEDLPDDGRGQDGEAQQGTPDEEHESAPKTRSKRKRRRSQELGTADAVEETKGTPRRSLRRTRSRASAEFTDSTEVAEFTESTEVPESTATADAQSSKRKATDTPSSAKVGTDAPSSAKAAKGGGETTPMRRSKRKRSKPNHLT